MIKESFIVNKLVLLIVRTIDAVENSYAFYLFICLGKYFERVSAESLIVNLLSSNWDKYLKADKSIFVGRCRVIIRNISRKIKYTDSRAVCMIKNSFFIKIANENMLLIFIYALLFLIPIAPTMILAFIAMVCIALYIFNTLMGRIKFQKLSVLGCMIFVFLLCYLSSTFTSYSVQKAIQIMIIFISFAAITFIVVKSLNSEKRLNFAINLVILSGVLISLYGIFQYFTGVEMDAAWIDANTFENISIRVYSTFSNPNVLGEYLIIITSLAVGMLWKEKNNKAKFVYLIAAAITGLCLFMTNSRGSMMGLLIAAAIFIVIAEKRFIIFGVIGLMLMPFILPDSIWNRLVSVVSLSDSSSLYRISIYKASINMIKDFWTTGIGVGAYNLIYPIYAFDAAYAYHSHNIFLQVFIELGILGITSFAAMVFFYLQKMYYGVRNSFNNYKYVIAVILGGFVGLLFQGLADYLWFDYSIVLLFWMVIGLGIAAVNVGVNKKNEQN